MVKDTKDTFIQKAREVHGDRYDYSRVLYIDSYSNVEIYCFKHAGVFFQRPNNHLKGKIGCLECSKEKFIESRSYTTEDFVRQAKKIHGDRYDYSIVEYINWKTKVSIICKKHGVFNQVALSHKQGRGCPKCKSEKLALIYKFSEEKFIEKAKKVHGNKYDYKSISYVNNNTKIKIICKKHGVFEQSPASHLAGSGCPFCGDMSGGQKNRLTKKEFLCRAMLIHGDLYDYENSDYITHVEKIKIRCKKHDLYFKQKPNNHLNGQGCPVCSLSLGEERIRLFLEKRGINYESEKRFKECKNIRVLPFDFYLSKLNTAIEFDGLHHFYPVYFGSSKKDSLEKNFNQMQIRDAIKTDFCQKSGIKLIRIPYFQFNQIEAILSKELGEERVPV